jgi:hypothetical protein
VGLSVILALLVICSMLLFFFFQSTTVFHICGWIQVTSGRTVCCLFRAYMCRDTGWTAQGFGFRLPYNKELSSAFVLALEVIQPPKG